MMVKETKNRDRASDVLTQLTREAKAGSVDSLDKIYRVLTPETCTIDVLEVALQYLRIELVPNLELGEYKDPSFKKKSRAALHGFLILGNITLACNSNVKLKSALVEQVVASLDGVLAWTALFLRVGWVGSHTSVKPDFREAYLFHSEFLSDLADTSPVLRRALFTTPAFSDLLLRIWMMKGENGEYFLSLASPKICPILSLFAMTVADGEGREVLYQRLFSRRRCLWSTLADAVVARVRTIGETPFGADPSLFSSRALKYIKRLLVMAHHFLAHDTLRRIFVAQRYLRTICVALNRLAAGLEKHRLFNIVEELIEPITILAAFVLHRTYRVVLNYRDLLSGGFITLLVRVIADLEPGEYREILSYSVFAFFGSPGLYTIYPCVLRGLAQVPLAEDKANKLLQNRIVSARWSVYQHFLSRRKAILNASARSSTICDNLSCNPNKRKSTSKQCSGCFSVVYCSEKCQREDWGELHKEECSSARGDNSVRRAQQTRYHHSARAFHMDCIAAEYNTYLEDGIQNGTPDEHPNLPPYEVLPVMYFTVPEVPLKIKYEPLDGSNAYGWDGGKDAKKSFESQGHFQSRYRRLSEGYVAGKEGPRVRLVLAVFPMGRECAVFLTVRLQKMTGIPWFRATYSLYRYGRLEEPGL